jgi:hypothetical protein
VSSHPWWESAIHWTVWFLVMSAVMGWLARSRTRPGRADEAGRLAQPRSTLWLGVACSLFFFGCVVAMLATGQGADLWWVYAVFLGLGVMSATMVVDYFVGRHAVSAAGLQFRKLLGRRGAFGGRDVASVRYSTGMKWFRLQTRDGDVVRLSAMLRGLPEFATLLLAHAPPEAIAPESLPVLQETAAGRPPSIWM